MKIYVNSKQIKTVCIILCFLIFSVLLFSEIIWAKCENTIYNIAKAEAQNKINNTIALIAEKTDTDNIIIITRDKDYNITSIELNTDKINKIKSRLCNQISSELENGKIKAEIKIGDIFSSIWTIGNGITFTVSFSGYSAYINEINTKTQSSGINQTTYSVYAQINLDYYVLLPRHKTKKITQNTTIKISETVIFGKVPTYYK